ncbi:MAG: autotransporter outer membrane beta-barrel domain-containing protein, partial [Candidatus Cryosericum sp.]
NQTSRSSGLFKMPFQRIIPADAKGDLVAVQPDMVTIVGGERALNGYGASIEILPATAAQDGYLSSTDWTAFDAKQAALSFGDLTAASNKISIGGTGTGALIGAGASVDVNEGNLTHNNLGGLTTGDPHTQYILADGSRAFTNEIKTSKAEVGIATLLALANTHSHVNNYGCAINFKANGSGFPDTPYDVATIQGIITNITTGDGALIFQTSNAGTLTEAARFNALGYLGLATATPACRLQVAETVTTSPRGIMSAQYNAGTDGARFHMRKARGSLASPAIVVTGDNLGRLVASGYDGVNYLETAAIMFGTEGTIGETRVPTNISFWTGSNAAPSVVSERMRINSAGNIGIGVAPTNTRVQISGVAGDSVLGIVASTTTGQSWGMVISAGTNSSDAALRIYNAASNVSYMYIRGDGTVGFGTTSPAAKVAINGGLNVGADTDPGDNNAYIAGDCSALTFTDRTPHFDGDALGAIKAIKGRDGQIDHSTLPEFARKVFSLMDSDGQITQEEGRDLGAMISMHTVALQQLAALVEELQAKAKLN